MTPPVGRTAGHASAGNSPADVMSMVESLNATAAPGSKLQYRTRHSFGKSLDIDEFEFSNGLRVLVCEDHSAPVVAYHTWFRVGSRHEREGKTGLSHLFEHLMFNETEHLKKGEFDRRLEEAGAESNASTWLDFTQYSIAVPRDQLGLVAELEAERMARLVLRDPQVESEKEVVANERLYRVEDDVEGAASELLWSTAFTKHAYRWPTIGWMHDIQAFDTADCSGFYRTYYAPNNATVVLVGDVTPSEALPLLRKHYGAMKRAQIPVEENVPEPPQMEERRVELRKPTTTEKLLVGYHGPAFGDFDHPAVSILGEVLFGGLGSRLIGRLVRKLELASEARIFVGSFRDPGLLEIFASARPGHTAEALLEVVDEELERVLEEPVSEREVERARARFELGLVSALETADGKASTIGFYDTVLDNAGAAFDRLSALDRVTPSDLRRVARRYFTKRNRSIVLVRSTRGGSDEG